MVTQRMGRGGVRGRMEGVVEWVGVGDDDEGEEGGKKGQGEGKGRVDVRSQNALVLLEL